MTSMRFSSALFLLWGSSCFAAPLDSPPALTLTGYPGLAYNELESTLVDALREIENSTTTTGELCVAHSPDAAAKLLQDVSASTRCSRGVVLFGAAPFPESLQISVPVLTIHGSLDGVVRFSNFAVARHLSQSTTCRFATILGASHHSLVSSAPSSELSALDLAPETSSTEVHASVATLVKDFLSSAPSGALAEAEKLAAKLSTPVTAALELEGSTMLGHPACNSDFPTNPTCKYTKWPDHSLPFGPAPAPSPALPSDCICGSPWVIQHATKMIGGLDQSSMPTATVVSNDAFQDVSDTHPFHLPHIFNSCKNGDTACVLNVTSLTMPYAKAGDLFPNATSPPLSIYEFRTKIKSREAIWEAAGMSGDSSLDSNMTMCKAINQLAYDWALDNAEASARAKFEKDGEPFVMVDDKVATIGITGPEWIKDELVYARTKAADGSSQIEIQSWTFEVGNTNGGDVPWFYPVGMHYCKLLSPARAMEWIYTDGLRAKLATA